MIIALRHRFEIETVPTWREWTIGSIIFFYTNDRQYDILLDRVQLSYISII